MVIDCVSDLHGFEPPLEGGDLLIIAGDLVRNGSRAHSYLNFLTWLSMQPYKRKIIVAGNHDNLLAEGRWESCSPEEYFPGAGMEYLEDSGTQFEGLKIWGSPWTLRFDGINPECCAFIHNSENEIEKKWELIPTDTDILVTHSPPFSIRDRIGMHHQAGSLSLMAHHLQRIRPKLWVFGHIHESYGKEGPYHWNETNYVNASYVNEIYEPVNKPIRIII